MEENLQKELDQFQEIYQMVIEFFVQYSFQLFGALIILFIGLLVARKAANAVFKLCEKKQLDITLSRFIASTVKLLVIVMVAIIALGKLGISVTPFLAAVGALSLGAGLAVQGLLSNYGAGLNIILTRPYVVGDTISVQGVTGKVDEVHLAFTILTNEDGTRINIPNRHIIGEILHNSFSYTIAELSIGIAYDEDPDRAIHLIEQALSKVDAIDAHKAPQVGIEAFADSCVNLGIRVWLPTEHYYEQLYRVNRLIYAALKDNGITIPFPQREVRLLQ